MDNLKEEIREYLYRESGVRREVLSEREIAERFSVKRNQARELLLELVGEGVVERHPRSGYRYVDYRATDTRSAIMFRYMVELEAAALAVTNADREDEVRLVLAGDALRRAADAENLPDFFDADREFHTVLVRASHDNMLIRIYNFLQATLFRKETVLRATFSGQYLATLKAHEAILRAFLDRDGTKLQALLKRHLGYQKLQSRLEELSTPIPGDAAAGAAPEGAAKP